MPQKIFIGRLENLSQIGVYISKAARRAGLDDESIYAVELAVDEAATNIIEHGYGSSENGKIICAYEILPDGIKITLKDNARKFDPDAVPEPSFHGKSIENLSPRGLGLFFIRKMMDEVVFDFTPGVGNTLTLIKRKKRHPAT
jgi:serine/threonine-protein kinase RsbW